MNKEESLFFAAGDSVNDDVRSQVFGKPCFKINGKDFICLFRSAMVFKLSGNSHKEAHALSGSQLFDPSDQDRPMKEWVQVLSGHSDKWELFALAAADYVRK